MIAAHGATVTITNEMIRIVPTALTASLTGHSGDVAIAVAEVRAVDVAAGDSWDDSVVTISTATEETRVYFPPGAVSDAEELARAVAAAQSGEAPAESSQSDALPGLDFVAFDVETANGNWGSICQLGAVKFIDGVETERVSWLCCPPPGLDTFDPFNVNIHGISHDDVAAEPAFAERVGDLVSFIGDLPIVAHNAQFDATALRQACVASGVDVPHILFACTLAQSRASSLGVRDHKLPTVSEHLGVTLDKHHDACADAAACGEVLVELARRAGHSGSVMDFIHATGFTLGVIEPGRVVPVLRDRSGASRAMQAARVEKISGGADPQAADISPAPEVSGAGTDQPAQRRGPAPWQSVATPDTIPDANEDADPSHPLYGQNVTLTGEFEPFDKGTLWSGIAEAGGHVGKNVTKKTTILVAGEWATMTSKEKRARELQEKGQDIEIWPGDKLLSVLGLDEQPPF